MIRRVRKFFRGGVIYGVLLTLTVVGAKGTDPMESLGDWFYDRRARDCQFFTPPPTDRLVHLDIDDAAIEAVGEWPWPRSALAEMVDEIHLAGPKAMAFDVVFDKPQSIRHEPAGDGTYLDVRDDDVFAAALQRLGCALVPISLHAEREQALSPTERALRHALSNNLELTEAAAAERLKAEGLAAGGNAHDFINAYLKMRREVMNQRVMAELRKSPRTPDQLRALLLPHTDPNLQSAARRLLDEQYIQVSSLLNLVRFSRPLPTGIPPLLHAATALAPVASLSKSAQATGFVDYIPDPHDGTVRRVTLFVEHDDQMYPQIGLALAAMMLDADLANARVTENEITIPRHGGPPLVIPVYTHQSPSMNRAVPTTFDIPWFGPTNKWEAMYDRVGGAHLSINVVWDACLTQQRIRRNNMQVDDALRGLYQLLAPEKFEPFDKHPLPLDDPLNRLDLCRAALAEYGPFIQDAEKTNLAEIKDAGARADTEKLAAVGRPLRYVIAENPKLQQQLITQRRILRQRLQGRAILVGWAATSQTADLVATSIHNSCPGAVVHGVIFNALMTGRMWRRAPPWTDVVLTLLMGALTTLFTSRMSPTHALTCTLALAGFYMGINGIVLFAWRAWIFPMAGPMVAAGLVWSGITLFRLLAESAEHRRIRRRFQSYIDPTLVNYVYEHPEIARLTGQVREMTVCFSDLMGFTAFTEEFRERAVRVLGRYTSRMVPCIRRHRGLVHRFMGDGLMFSYGAPIENADHAADAISTILEMHEAMAEFNREIVAEGYPELRLRAGASTGEVVVGDTGADDACDYTCLGDVTNFAARLETANKVVGTRALISARTAELIGERFLLRPIARLRVAGKKLGVLTYEPLAHAAAATDEQKRLAAMTTEMVEYFWAQRLDDCIEAARRLDEAFGPSLLTTLYQYTCHVHMTTPPAEFTGQIVLDQK
jgi:CHASE2 domain-containing sensor protein